MEAIKIFLDNLKELMFDNCLSFERLGKQVQINPRSMRRWYDGIAPKLESIIKIADYFECSIDFLLGISDDIDFIPSLNPSNFIMRYQSLLKENKLNDYRVSKLCKIGTGTISKWKYGRTPDLPTLIKLCKIFECHFEYLIGKSDNY